MRILLVDDEKELTEPLSRLLQRQGYTVDIASDGITGSDLATGGSYDLLILDWMLPGKTGLDICREIRAQQSITPVLFLTAKDTVDDRVDGLDAGADDYLVKPFELRELLARVRALLRRPTVIEAAQMTASAASGSAASSTAKRTEKSTKTTGRQAVIDAQANASILTYGDLVLHPNDQFASRNGKTLELSDKEVQLLGYLMRSPHQLLTHTQIYDAVWGEGATPSSNALAAQMRLLRKKVEQPGQPTLIHTVYGKGYRFGSPT